MGGLLAGDAATDPSNNPGGRPKRIVGVVAFDTPFLGMHPHVVVSGIASLLPKEGEKGKKEKSERSMNEHPNVNVVDQGVTDDWEAFKKQTSGEQNPFVASVLINSCIFVVYARNAPYSSESSSLGVVPQIRSPSPSPAPSFMERALSYVPAKNTDDPVVKWLRKHADDPFSAGKRWITERFQFGSCMFDPGDLKRRYSLLVDWGIGGGMWVNYWTTTVPKVGQRISANSNDHNAVAPTDDWRPVDSSHKEGTVHLDLATEEKSRKQEEKKAMLENKRMRKEEKEALKEEKKKQSVHHFVVLPNGVAQYLGGLEKWENVPIAGVEDEVGAHTGLFIPNQNFQYEALVERVSSKVLDWCERLAEHNI